MDGEEEAAADAAAVATWTVEAGHTPGPEATADVAAVPEEEVAATVVVLTATCAVVLTAAAEGGRIVIAGPGSRSSGGAMAFPEASRAQASGSPVRDTRRALPPGPRAGSPVSSQ